MSQQEVLYETDQYTIYKGKKFQIRFIEEYFDMVPRPIDEEKEFLKQDIKKDGLIESIKINSDGIVLDGHTRIEICEELRWTKENEEPIEARYEVKEFKDKEEERKYVLKTNLMRRQLNSFQKVRLASKLYNDNIHSRREQARYDILLALKKHGEPVNSSTLGEELGQHRAYILKLLRGLKEDYCANYKIVKEGKGQAINSVHHYYILPKGEEVLSKERPQKVTLKSLGISIGVSRISTERSVFLLNHASPNMIARLENGKLSISKAYMELTRKDEIKRVMRKGYLRGRSKVICPHCDQVSMKKEWKIYNGKD